MKAAVAVAKALADDSRLRVAAALGTGELCVCQITALLELAPSTVSKHLSILEQAGLIEGRKEGRWMYYRLSRDKGNKAAAAGLKWLAAVSAEDPQIARDQRRLEAILQIKPETLCRRQRRC